MDSQEEIKKIIKDIAEKSGMPIGDEMEKMLETKAFDMFQFAKEEEKIINRQKEAVQSVGNLLIQNIMGARNFLLALTGFSLTILGVGLSVYISRSEIIKSEIFFLLGLCGFVFCITGSLIYLAIRFTHENQRLSEFLNFHKTGPKKLHKKMLECFEKGKNFHQYIEDSDEILEEIQKTEKELQEKSQKDNNRKDYWIVSFTLAFIISIVLIIFSLFLKFPIETISQPSLNI